MNKKLLKIITVVLMVIMIVSISISSLAASELQPGNLTGDKGAKGTEEITSVGNSIIGILQVVGIVLSVIVLIVLGIKYMMGSASEKAEYKKTMIPYLVGAVLIFGASAIAKAVIAMSSSITGGA